MGTDDRDPRAIHDTGRGAAMSTLRAWFWRLGGMFGKQRRDRELADELACHLQMHIDESVRVGFGKF